MKFLSQRIQRLEAALPPLQKKEPVCFPPWLGEIFNKLLSTMDPTHARLVRDDFRGLATGREGGILEGLAIERVGVHLEEARPLALPPAVAAIYLKCEHASVSHQCEDCGYEVPVWIPHQYSKEPILKYFPQCPLCGGNTGLLGFALKQKYHTPAHRLRALEGTAANPSSAYLSWAHSAELWQRFMYP
jgi:hypothetical protein